LFDRPDGAASIDEWVSTPARLSNAPGFLIAVAKVAASTAPSRRYGARDDADGEAFVGYQATTSTERAAPELENDSRLVESTSTQDVVPTAARPVGVGRVNGGSWAAASDAIADNACTARDTTM